MIGDALVWGAVILTPPIMALPFALLVAGDDDSDGAERGSGARRARGAIVWTLAVGLAVLGALVFVHFAVDLPKVGVDAALFVALAGMLAVTAGVGAAIGVVGASARLARLFESVACGVGRAAAWLVFAMALVQFATVVLRYVFGLNFIFMQESVTYMHGAVFLAAAGYALLTDDHVRVDLFYRDAPPRRKALVDFCGVYLFLFPFCLMTLWTASPYVGAAWAAREGSTEQSGIQGVYLLKTLIPVFSVLLMMAGFTIAWRAARTLRGERP